MRVNSTTNLKIACVIGCENNRDVCKFIHLRVNPEATDDDLLLAGKTIAALQTLPLHSIDRADCCDLTE